MFVFQILGESVQEMIENCSPGESITDFEEEVSLLLAEAKNRAIVVELSDALNFVLLDYLLLVIIETYFLVFFYY